MGEDPENTFLRSLPLYSCGLESASQRPLLCVWKPEFPCTSSRQMCCQSADAGVSGQAPESHLLWSCRPVALASQNFIVTSGQAFENYPVQCCRQLRWAVGASLALTPSPPNSFVSLLFSELKTLRLIIPRVAFVSLIKLWIMQQAIGMERHQSRSTEKRIRKHASYFLPSRVKQKWCPGPKDILSPM